MTRLCVVGAGQMGAGIAQVAAVAGYDVTLVDVSPAQLDRARAGIERSLGKLVAKDSVDAEAAGAALGRIVPAAGAVASVAKLGHPSRDRDGGCCIDRAP